MTRRNCDDAEIGVTLLLGSLVVAACVAWIEPMVDSLALRLMSSGGTVGVAATGRTCNSCGIIQQVRELDAAVPRHEVSTVAGGGTEGIAVILGALGGKLRRGPGEVYEIEVRMRDGSVRTFRSATPSSWKPGDQVKVIMGKIEPA
ncbi:MAG TPA: hypothetical protein VKS43_01590 [Burkholderiales bacterium]|nr:hypothetical protein [Burkholderiales bacterium]